jgi:hypothetical protein
MPPNTPLKLQTKRKEPTNKTPLARANHRIETKHSICQIDS